LLPGTGRCAAHIDFHWRQPVSPECDRLASAVEFRFVGFSAMKNHERLLTWLPRFAALLLSVLAMGWLWTFGFSDFRQHQRIPMLMLAAIVLAYAVFLAARYSWAVFSSVVLSLLVAAIAIYLQALGHFLNPILVVVAALSLGYAFGLGFALKADRRKRG